MENKFDESLTNRLIAGKFQITPFPVPNQGILFVNHAPENRSGHLGHALVENICGEILAFYPNCSADNDGHSAVGWMEYKRSGDGGLNWSEPAMLDYSRQVFDRHEGRSAMAEKAVLTENGTVILFHLISDIRKNPLWEPYFTPTYTRSFDGGATWTDAKTVDEKRGRVYDALNKNGTVYALKFCNDATENWVGTKKEHVYNLYVSEDNGETFHLRSTIPFDTSGRGYGTMEFLENGSLIVYVYNSENESQADYAVSEDQGNTWKQVGTAFLQKKIRNPQLIHFYDGYFMHGRSGNYGEDAGNFVLYYSEDGIHWDDGRFLCLCTAGYGAYSNSLVIGKSSWNGKKRLLIQASHAYDKNKTNILHWWIDKIE